MVIIILLLALVANCSDVWATVGVVRYGSGTPVQACVPSDSNGACYNYASGNVGIGTIGETAYFVTPGDALVATNVIQILNNQPILAVNVGIGSVHPGQALDVQGNGRFSGTLSASNLSGTNTGDQDLSGLALKTTTITANSGLIGGGDLSANRTISIGTTGVSAGTYTYSTVTVNNLGQVTSASSGTTPLTTIAPITLASPNVGIGSAVPGQVLDVAGTARMTGFNLSTSPTTNYVLTSDTNGNGTWQVSQSTTPGSPVNSVQFNSASAFGGSSNFVWDGTNLGVGTSSPKNLLTIVGNVGIGTEPYSNYVTTSTPVRSVVIESNVGIGTWKPLYVLEARSTAASAGDGIVLSDNAASNPRTGGFVIGGSSDIAFGTISDNITEFVSDNGGGMCVALGKSTSKTMGINRTTCNSASGDIYLDTNGNVGINLSSLADKFAVNGNAAIGSYAGNVAPANGFIVSGNTGIGTYNPNAAFEVGTHAFDVLSGGNVGIATWIPNAALVVNGNVGIGTVFANNKLEVVGTAEITGFKLNSGAVNNYVLTSDASGNGTWAAVNASNFWLNDTGNVGINTTYSVGIGTISQVNTLNVLGNIGIGTVAGDAYLTTAAPLGGAIVYGNVGLGSTNPSNALEINGHERILGTKKLYLGGDANSYLTSSATTSADIQVYTNTRDTSTGGTVTTVAGQTIRTFNSSGTFVPSFTGTVQVLVVAGGGGGGGGGAGGGGAGGLTYNASYNVTANSGITVTIGAGGAGGGQVSGSPGLNGSNSVFGTITDTGGGGGGSANGIGGNGGSGGGNGYVTQTPATGTAGQGNNGGNGAPATTYGTGGGGGANAVGGTGNGSAEGNGGSGLSYTISGASVCYAGGGGAGVPTGAATAGTGTCGGGNGGNGISPNATAGTANTGGGGGGASNSTTAAGGSGVVIVSYAAGAPTETTRFTQAGNVGINQTAPVNRVDIGGNVGIGTLYAGIYSSPLNGMLIQGNIGIGTFLPSSSLSIGTNGISIGTSYTNGVSAPTNGLIVLGNVGIGTAAPQSLLVVKGGDLRITGTAPSLTSCGTSPAITGNDNGFRVTVGSTTNTCNVSFNTTKTNTPSCACFDEVENLINAFSYTPSTSGVNTSQTAEGGTIFDCICIPN